MIDKTQMTIDAYLRQAGLKPQTATSSKNFIPLKPVNGTGFGEVLNDLTSTDGLTVSGHSKGTTIAEYLSQRSSSARSGFFSQSTLGSGLLSGGYRNRLNTAMLQSASRAGISETAVAQMTAAPASTPENVGQIGRSIRKAAKKYNLPEDLIESVIRAESDFQPDAVSPAGAQGLMQLMPATARELGVTDPFDVQQNIDGGARYIRQMLDRFDGDVKLALAAYNAGPGTVDRYHGDVPYRETQNYVKRVLAGMSSTSNVTV
ncbi:hypothetical protein DSCO28_42700 [Desulfosarcina ovata subsp. sediminis]|uniref:Transglycosylase SLT domain-containing protein n=1 Tax=Desulfosarcina ovata subsp. sediminis TaxID=885957 RepID=A0A5K7ZU55_9BACT|nr:lytic transglycosylase domain-containing protein [Desulfosarcina ovata]BBO83704.1 hypothetical protein DSCO28_42700 [Desulfosarcina ovata subsp. sediminis]